MRDTQRQAEGEGGSLWEAHVGLHPRTPGSRPEPKADAQPLSHPGAPNIDFWFMATNEFVDNIFCIY